MLIESKDMVNCGIYASVGAARWQNDNIRKCNYFSFTEQLIKEVDIREFVPYCFPLQNFAVFEFFLGCAYQGFC